MTTTAGPRTDRALVALPCQTDVTVQCKNRRVVLRRQLRRRVLLVPLHALRVSLVVRAFVGLAGFVHPPPAGNGIPLQDVLVVHGGVVQPHLAKEVLLQSRSDEGVRGPVAARETGA